MLDVEFNNVAILSKNFRYKIRYKFRQEFSRSRSEKQEADNGKKRKIFIFHFSLKAKENKLINSLKEEKK